jgi:hypothetical protein
MATYPLVMAHYIGIGWPESKGSGTFQFLLCRQPELYVASVGAAVLYPERMGALAGMVAFFGLRRHL